MRRRFRILAVLLILSLTTALLPAPAMAAETENTGSDFDLLAEIKAANNGDTIQIPMGAVVKNGATDARPLFIEKSVTIQGGSITLWAGGIMLGADVTFKDTSLIFATNSRNAIIANGHTLILDNVSAGQYSFNLFCGGLLKADFETFDVPDPGPVGTIIIKGNTNLQSKNEYGSGDIYAGNLCMGGMNADKNGPDDNGPANDFAGDAVIEIEGAASSTALGDIYACGAQQRIPVNATSGKITLSDPDKYTVSGTVSVSGKTPNVYGAGGASAVDVAFGNDGNQASLTMTGISHLTVDSGDLALRHGSGFENLTLSSGAKLNLSDMGNCDTGDLDSGGGILVLGRNQTFTIRGAVSGDTTQLAIGGVNSSNGSTAKPAALHTYIQAPGSNDTSFRLLPSGAGDPEFSRDGMGNWTTGEEPVLVKSFAFLTAAASIDTAGNMAELDLVVEGLDYLDFTPLEIYVNDVLAARNDELDEYGGFYYTYTSEFSDELIDISANTLYFAPKENGTYTIKITVPAVHTVNGQPLSSTAVLTVGAENPPPGHTHDWDATWAASGTHHWHNCIVADCPTTDDSQKNGYAAHTAGGWIVDQQPTASVPGSRYKACTVCGYETDREEIPATGGETPGHTHVWAAQWSSDKTHHWHNCTAEGCTATLEQLNGYAAHTAGDWIVDQQPTASVPGSRYKTCTVCGYETDREEIPATGGSSGSNRPSRPSSGSSSTSTTTQRNPDGSTITTQTNHITGTVTKTIRNPDGSQTVVETRKDGTVTSTEKTANGSTVKTVETPDGSREITVQQSNGVTAQVSVDRWGTAEAEVKLTAKSISQNGAVPLPIPDLPVTKAGSAQVTVHTGSTKPVRVEIPVTNPTPGTVAVIVNADGSETVVKSSLLTGAGLTAAVSDGAVVKIVDNSKAFPDTASHWARDAVDFVSARQLFSGQSASAFAPNGTMTRAMLITAVARLDGVNTAGGASWHERSMAWAVQQGISDGTNPGGQITREQLVTVLYRYAGSPAASALMPFSDTNAISSYAYDAMRWAVENDILSGYGDGTLAPQAQATRAQAAMMLMRYMNFCGRS